MCAIMCSFTFGRVLFINVCMSFECDVASRIYFSNVIEMTVTFCCPSVAVYYVLESYDLS